MLTFTEGFSFFLSYWEVFVSPFSFVWMQETLEGNESTKWTQNRNECWSSNKKNAFRLSAKCCLVKKFNLCIIFFGICKRKVKLSLLYNFNNCKAIFNILIFIWFVNFNGYFGKKYKDTRIARKILYRIRSILNTWIFLKIK